MARAAPVGSPLVSGENAGMLSPADIDELKPSPGLAKAAAALLERYEFGSRPEIELLHQSENTLYLVRDGDGPRRFVLRVHSHRMRYHTERSILSELLWMSALRAEAGIETPEAVPARDGSLVQRLAGADRLAVMFTFLEGNPPPETDLVPEFWRLGEIAARMHRHAQSWNPPVWFVRPSWTPETILGDMPLWGSWRAGVGMTAERIAVIGRAASAIERSMAALPRDRDNYGLIHADMRLANLLVAGERTRVIDFDDCGFGWFGYDLATALSFIQERSDVPELIEAWLAGYRRVQPLAQEFLTALPSLIMLRRINEIAWLGATQHVVFARDLAPRFAIDSCRLADDYLRTHG